MEIDIGNYSEAEKLCRKALAINPDYANAHTTLGRALWGMGLKDDGKLEIDKASQLLRFEK